LLVEQAKDEVKFFEVFCTVWVTGHYRGNNKPSVLACFDFLLHIQTPSIINTYRIFTYQSLSQSGLFIFFPLNIKIVCHVTICAVTLLCQ
jgi:hypothetical protein